MTLLCDFCNRETTDDNGERTHYTAPFDLTFVINGDPIPIHFTEAWLACTGCHQLIVAGDKERLLIRSLDLATIDTESVKLIQALFWKNKR